MGNDALLLASRIAVFDLPVQKYRKIFCSTAGVNIFIHIPQKMLDDFYLMGKFIQAILSNNRLCFSSDNTFVFQC